VSQRRHNSQHHVSDGLEVPLFPGEAVYHTNKAAQEAFTNALRNELNGMNIKVLALRPGCVATNYHFLRVGHDKGMYDSFLRGIREFFLSPYLNDCQHSML
jgi:short-subunit dehydrogenase